FSSRRRHTRFSRDWSSDVCSSDLGGEGHRRSFVLLAVPPDETPAEPVQAERHEEQRQPDGEDRVVVDAVVAEVAAGGDGDVAGRSEERRGGNGWSTRWSNEHNTTN